MGRSAPKWGKSGKKRRLRVPKPFISHVSGVKAGQLVGGEHHESKAFWSHDRAGDVAGSRRWQVVVEVTTLYN